MMSCLQVSTSFSTSDNHQAPECGTTEHCGTSVPQTPQPHPSIGGCQRLPGVWRGVPGTKLLFSEWMHLLAGGLGGGNEASQA